MDIQFFQIPTVCPSCGFPLVRDGEYLVCRGEDCEAQASGSIKRWVKKIGVLHVGDTLIEAMAERFPEILTDAEFQERFEVPPGELYKLSPEQVSAIFDTKMDIADLYVLDVDKVAALDLSGHRVGSLADKALTNLQNKRTLPLHVLVGSLGIPLIGRDTAKNIVDAGYNSLSKMYKAKISEIAALPGMGGTKARAFVLGFAAKVGLIGKLLTTGGITIQDNSGPLVGQSFCLTGFRDASLVAALEKAGGTVKSGVSKGLTYLIAQDANSTSEKAKKARALGTQVISISEALDLIK